MIQTLDFYYAVKRDPQEMEKIMNCLSKKSDSEIIVGRHKLTFDYMSQIVTIDKASDTVPFAVKICKARMPYDLMGRVLEGDFDDMTGFELL